jgi:5-oxoprolinase (ATP-hydrolysing)
LLIPYKLLSENPERYNDAAIQGIRNILNLSKNDNIPVDQIECVKMGTTVATNALLERKGERTLLIINEGFKDALRIAYQTRPRLFDLNITLPELLYEDVAELSVRTAADGKVTQNLNPDEVHKKLLEAYKKGIRSCAIVLMHGYRYPEHETKIANIARDIGYEQISLSHETSPLIKLISRGDTTVVDAYLSPILRHYVNLVADELGQTTLMFMQSNGGLIRSDLFQGKDSILSGPAGGIVGAVKVAHNENLEKIIAFDMGGTSTDVAHYSNEYERSFETEVAGVRMRVPMMNIHTVAAGGGSVLSFDGTKYKVGPESAGANPGPASYKRGGPLTVTDCNVMLGKIQPAFFPHVFGPNADQPLDYEIVNEKFEELSSHIHKLTGDLRSPHEVAEGFLKIAVDNMANAIKKISVQRGYDITDYTLSCYGGASGQHACLVADALGMQKIYIDNLAGVLSAYGMGLADIRALREKSIEKPLETNLDLATKTLDELCVLAGEELKEQDIESYKTHRRLHIKYAGTDTSLIVPESNLNEIEHTFNAEHKSRFGFIIEGKALEIETVSVELVGVNEHLHYSSLSELNSSHDVGQEHHIQIFTSGTHNKAPIIKKGQLSTNQIIQGPAIIADNNTTIVIEPEWQASMTKKHNLILTRIKAKNQMLDLKTDKDPVMLEIFNNLYMSIAEQMGKTLENTAYSINIKERLDFSCAVFDHTGSLIANAPHMPVHLGSMGMAVKNVIDQNKTMKKGDVYMVNDPYNGGTHLPDITIITPVFYGHEINAPIFYVASRGHHADIGGLTPGSMPPDSCSIEEEGILFNNFLI